jgi:hypothetical protein
MIQINYSYRNSDPNAYAQAVDACRKQISIASKAAQDFKKNYSTAQAENWWGSRLPPHTGYGQLAVILEKEKRYAEALQLVKQAKAQGWAGDWDKDIARLEKKAQK